MQLTYKLIIITITSLTYNAFAYVKEQVRDPHKYFFNPGFNVIKDELDVARENGNKALLIMCNEHKCPWSKNESNSNEPATYTKILSGSYSRHSR